MLKETSVNNNTFVKGWIPWRWGIYYGKYVLGGFEWFMEGNSTHWKMEITEICQWVNEKLIRLTSTNLMHLLHEVL